MNGVTWGAFVVAEPELAAFGAGRLRARPAYLATVRANGRPRVHPVTPVITDRGLYVFTEPASPKAKDLELRGWYSVHTGVPDNEGTGGEFTVSGRGHPVQEVDTRAAVVTAASYDPEDDYLLFELRLDQARAKGYGDTPLPSTLRWSAGESG